MEERLFMNKFFDYEVLMGIKESEKPHIPLMDELLSEVLAETEKMMWSLARNTTIPGYDADDLMQEMRIKVWRTIKDSKYDPEQTKPTSFYYRVCKNCLIDVRKSKIPYYNTTKPENRHFRDSLDHKIRDNQQNLDELDKIETNFDKNLSEDFKKYFVEADFDHILIENFE